MRPRGAALPLAVLALLVVGVLVAASFALGRQELALGANTLHLQEALASAEGGVDLQLALWDRAVVNALAVGDSVPFGGVLPTGGWYRGSIRRLNDPLFVVRAEGFSRDSAARQELGLIVRLEPVEVARTAGLATRGAIVVRDLAVIDGDDASPPGWIGCGPPAASVAGIRTPDSAGVATGGCADPSCVRGAPAVLADATLDSAALWTFGGVPFDDLRGRASVSLPGGTRAITPSLIGGVCNTGDPDNWGSPTSPQGACGSRFPLVWSEGDLTVNGGEGQGVLAVNGDLTLAGGFLFVGVVIVRGRLVTAGAGGRIYGAVVAPNAAGASHEIGGNSALRFSLCAMDRALLGSAPPGPLRSRSWVGLW